VPPINYSFIRVRSFPVPFRREQKPEGSGVRPANDKRIAVGVALWGRDSGESGLQAFFGFNNSLRGVGVPG
jgi:hypothetical protein